jgi:hypothetical protein
LNLLREFVVPKRTKPSSAGHAPRMAPVVAQPRPRNRVRCRKCLETIESRRAHEYVTCRCGAIWVDGGRDQPRQGGRDAINLEVLP